MAESEVVARGNDRETAETVNGGGTWRPVLAMMQSRESGSFGPWTEDLGPTVGVAEDPYTRMESMSQLAAVSRPRN